MTPEEIVTTYLKRMEAMDFDSALELVAEDLEYINGNAEAVRGHEGVRQTLEPFFAPLERNEFLIERKAVNGDTVFVERLDRHLPKGGGDDDWFELPVTGVCEVKDGKIVYWREYFDLAVIQEPLAKLLQG